MLAIVTTISFVSVNVTIVYELVCAIIVLGKEIIRVVCMYVPPKCRLVDVGDLFESIQSPKLISGDFNAHAALWGQKPEDARGKTLTKAI